MTLEKLREQLDVIDDSLLKLLNLRAFFVAQIGLLKKKNGMEIVDEKREQEIFQKLLQNNPGHFSDEAIIDIFKVIIQKCRELQRG